MTLLGNPDEEISTRVEFLSLIDSEVDRLTRLINNILNLSKIEAGKIEWNIKEFAVIIPGMRHHHEKFGSKGYPDGLKGEEIPLIGRIIAVANVFDAMTSDRSYRKNLGDEEALKRIKDSAGTQFDPQMVDVFLHLFENDRP